MDHQSPLKKNSGRWVYIFLFIFGLLLIWDGAFRQTDPISVGSGIVVGGVLVIFMGKGVVAEAIKATFFGLGADKQSDGIDLIFI